VIARYRQSRWDRDPYWGDLVPPSMIYNAWWMGTPTPGWSNPGGCHRRILCHQRLLQQRWWLLPDLPAAPPRGLSSTSPSTTVVVTTGLIDSTPRGVSSTVSSAMVLAAVRSTGSTPLGSCHRRLAAGGSYCQYFLATPSRGHYDKHYYGQDRWARGPLPSQGGLTSW
jgi:hypothetical protein